MKVQNVDWKYKIWITAIVLGCIGLLSVFSYQAVRDMGNSIVIMTADEYQQSLK